MAVTCPRCGKEYDVTLFQFGKRVQCPCGCRVELEKGHEIALGGRGRATGPGLAEAAERIRSLILDEGVSDAGIREEVEKLRSLYLESFPDGDEGFQEAYGSSLDRLFRRSRGEDLFP